MLQLEGIIQWLLVLVFGLVQRMKAGNHITAFDRLNIVSDASECAAHNKIGVITLLICLFYFFMCFCFCMVVLREMTCEGYKLLSFARVVFSLNSCFDTCSDFCTI